MEDLEHFTPETLEEAAALLMAADSQIRPMAQGTTLIARGTGDRQTTSVVLDLKRIPEMNRLDFDERNGLRIGAAVPFTTFLLFPPVRQLYPILADGSLILGPVEMQDRFTLGETLGGPEASPDLTSPLICLRASTAIFGPHGWSEMAVESLFAGGGGATLHPGEFMVDVRLPAPVPRANGAYLPIAQGEATDSAVGGIGAFLVMEEDFTTCCGGRLTLSGLTPKPFRATEAERFLVGKPLEEAVLWQAGELVAQCVAHLSQPEGRSSDYLEQVKALTRRAILCALDRIRVAATT